MPHYFELVRALAGEHIPQHPEVIAARDAMLDATCYPDPNNMVLAQDILEHHHTNHGRPGGG